MTDRENCLGVLEQNVAFNNLQDRKEIQIRALEWGEELRADLKEPFDVILGESFYLNSFCESESYVILVVTYFITAVDVRVFLENCTTC